jgi:hypothetical protein
MVPMISDDSMTTATDDDDEGVATAFLGFSEQGDALTLTTPLDHADGPRSTTMTIHRVYSHDEIAALAEEAEHDSTSHDDWRYEVANGDTELGYADWIADGLSRPLDFLGLDCEAMTVIPEECRAGIAATDTVTRGIPALSALTGMIDMNRPHDEVAVDMLRRGMLAGPAIVDGHRSPTCGALMASGGYVMDTAAR